MTIKRLYITLFAACAFGMTAMAQTARQVLDQTASKLRSSGGIEAAFEATRFEGVAEKGTTDGQILVQGNKFRITSGGLTTWFDGRTQWTLLSGSDEVNVSTPTEAEVQQMNPYSFVNLYKKGYKLGLASTTYQGKPCHEVRLTAENAQNSIQLLIIVIDKKTGLPCSIRLRDSRRQWSRIRVNSLKTHRKWSDATFRYDAKQHPGIEVIDLR